jgi:ribosomal protein L16 Arg81 hydroxylase
MINDLWRSWIAENLILGNSSESMLAAMVSNGIPEANAILEIEAAKSSPYIQGGKMVAERTQTRLKKCNWFMDVQRNLNHQSGRDKQIDKRYQLTREEFYRDYYFANKPVLISGMLEDWSALKKWSLSYFKEQYGDRVVHIQTGRDKDAAYEIEQNNFRSTMPLLKYIEQIEAAESSNDFYMTANNTSGNREALKELWDDVGELSEYLNPESSDDGFLWIGPAGTRTPFHHDLTNNFMAQIIGAKKIKLIAPCESSYVYNHLHCYSLVDGAAIDLSQFPLMKDVTVMEFELNAGEILFLPVGWWHYVEGLSPSVTMSFINFQQPNNASQFYSTYGPI